MPSYITSIEPYAKNLSFCNGTRKRKDMKITKDITHRQYDWL